MVTQWVWFKGNGVELLELRWCYWFLVLIVVVWMQEKLNCRLEVDQQDLLLATRNQKVRDRASKGQFSILVCGNTFCLTALDR